MKPLVSTELFLLKYSPKISTPPVAKRYLAVPNHALRPKIAHMYAHRDRNTLWWRVAKGPLQSYNGVVRSWCARRTRLAFKQALAARGFDEEGRKILNRAGNGGMTTTTTTTTTTAAETGLDRGLVGSVEIAIQPACIRSRFSTIQEEMGSILDTLLQEMIRSRDYTEKSKSRNRSRSPN